MYCISISGLSLAVYMSVLSGYCVFILLHCVSLCSLVFLYSLSATFCLPVLTFGPFSVWGFVPPLLFEALSSFYWGFVLMLYQGFVLVFYIEASSSYFTLYFEASSSYFILRLCPHILFWAFVLIFYIEASSSLFYIEAMFLSSRLWSSLL